jgi:hypothetical protein
MTTGHRIAQERGLEGMARSGVNSGATPSSIDPDDPAAVGTGPSFAFVDHQHAIVAAVANTITPDATPAEGSASSFSRSDHTHGAATATAGTITGSNAEGSSSSFARADHDHAYGSASVSEAAIVGTMPRGVVAQFASSSDSSGFTATGATDMVINNVPVVEDHMYMIVLQSRALISVTTPDGIWALQLHVNGGAVGEFEYMQRPNSRTSAAQGVVFWTAPTTQATDDFLVQAVEVAGTSTLTLIAAAGDRTLTIIDLGVL